MARAVGHVGWELLLDGTLLGTPAEDAYREALAAAGRPAVADGVRAEDRERWALFLTRWWPDAVLAYDDPATVAERLWHILGRRPRLALEVGHVATVATVLERHVGVVRASGPALLAATAAAAAAS